MVNHNIKAIIFDLGNVLVDFDHTIAAKRISRFSDKSPKEIFNLFFDSKLTSLFEKGKISPEDFFVKIKEMLNLNLNYEVFLPFWDEIFFLTEKNRAVYNLARNLKRNYKLALLSNINILHYEYLKINFPVFDVFHYIITSFEAGFQKPHLQIYRIAIEKLGVRPVEIFYTDDRRELIGQSRELGIQGFVFSNLEQLKKDLSDSGVTLD